jgi:hypothetical protein
VRVHGQIAQELGAPLRDDFGFLLDVADDGNGDKVEPALERGAHLVHATVAGVRRRDHGEAAPRRDDLAQLPRDLVNLLTTVFAELRRGQTLDGKAKVKSPSTVLSTAELISVMTNGALMGAFFGEGRASIPSCVDSLVGAVVKENTADLAVLDEYFETVVKQRRDAPWRELYSAGKAALGS